MKKEDIRYAKIDYQDDKYIIIDWSVKGIGFGQLVIDRKTHEILDDEDMENEFCEMIMDVALRSE